MKITVTEKVIYVTDSAHNQFMQAYDQDYFQPLLDILLPILSSLTLIIINDGQDKGL